MASCKYIYMKNRSIFQLAKEESCTWIKNKKKHKEKKKKNLRVIKRKEYLSSLSTEQVINVRLRGLITGIPHRL